MQPGHRRRQPYQTELFETPRDQPHWLELPIRVRSAVVQDLARLLGSLRHPQPQSESQGVRDE